MELKMQPLQLPEAPKFNYEQLMDALQIKMARYETAIYTDDEIKEAKADKAALNKLRKALNDVRIAREREYMQPFNDFKAKINELIGIIDRPISTIDKQIKEADERRKAEKRAEIYDYWQETGAPEWLHTIRPSWLNASYSIKTIKAEIDETIQRAEKQLAVIRKLPQFAFEAEEHYKANHSLDAAISEAHRLQEQAARKAAQETQQAAKAAEEAATIRNPRRVEPEISVEEPRREWIAFQALLSTEEARALGNYLKSNGIQYKAV